MQALEKALHWTFAFFLTIITFALCMVLMSFIGLKLAGAPLKPGADFHYEGSETLAEIYVTGTLCITLMAASYIGVITAPYLHRRASSYVFPIFVFFLVNISPVFSKSGYIFSFRFLAETALSCTVVWLLFYYKQRRRNLASPTEAP